MNMVDVLIEEHNRIDDAMMWSEEQKAAARSIVRGLAARTGVYRAFDAALGRFEDVAPAEFGDVIPFRRGSSG